MRGRAGAGPGAGGAARSLRVPPRPPAKGSAGLVQVVRQSRLAPLVGRRPPPAPSGSCARRGVAARAAEELRRRWHRSLQLRVVATTLALSASWSSPCSASSWSSRSPSGLLLTSAQAATRPGLAGPDRRRERPGCSTGLALERRGGRHLPLLGPHAADAQRPDGSYDVVIGAARTGVASPVYPAAWPTAPTRW